MIVHGLSEGARGGRASTLNEDNASDAPRITLNSCTRVSPNCFASVLEADSGGSRGLIAHGCLRSVVLESCGSRSRDVNHCAIRFCNVTVHTEACNKRRLNDCVSVLHRPTRFPLRNSSVSACACSILRSTTSNCMPIQKTFKERPKRVTELSNCTRYVQSVRISFAQSTVPVYKFVSMNCYSRNPRNYLVSD